MVQRHVPDTFYPTLQTEGLTYDYHNPNRPALISLIIPPPTSPRRAGTPVTPTSSRSSRKNSKSTPPPPQRSFSDGASGLFDSLSSNRSSMSDEHSSHSMRRSKSSQGEARKRHSTEISTNDHSNHRSTGISGKIGSFGNVILHPLGRVLSVSDKECGAVLKRLRSKTKRDRSERSSEEA